MSNPNTENPTPNKDKKIPSNQPCNPVEVIHEFYERQQIPQSGAPAPNKDHIIFVSVRGGVVDVENVPPGVTVRVEDYDVDGADETNLRENEAGDCYVLSEYGN